MQINNTVLSVKQKEEKFIEDGKEELSGILDEVKELLENIETSRSIPKQKKLYQRLMDHLSKHGWFYGAVIQLLGTSVMQMIGE